MGTYIILAVAAVFNVWLFRQFYQGWTEYKRIERDWELVRAQIRQTFGDTK